MNKIHELHDIYVRAKFGLSKWDESKAWALDRLMNNDEGEDNELVLLASSNSEEEMKELTESILLTYMSEGQRNDEYWAGKYILELYTRFTSGEIDIYELDNILLKLYSKLDYPNWLVMLSINCEYATDVPDFEKPFRDELEYIVGLWRGCNSLDEFNKVYDRNVSNKHDVPAANK